ncbi:unnamed protein product [Orchesella dallaii]|uniref:Peptidase M28 domain-containing protein n=1 Tax=Orchesella dallaii TaxID=48710 RepID=A0ABP1RXT2_9HEXA
MKINSGLLLFTIALAETFASPNDEIFNVKGTEPEPIYHSSPIYKATLQPLFLHLEPQRMKDFVQNIGLYYSDRNHGSDEASGAKWWISEEIRTILSHYKVGNGYLWEIQENLIAIVEGQDPNKKQNLVILGAHYDTVPNPKGFSSPGANDNASGCTVLIEVLRLIVQFEIRFKNTVEFHFYTGKEERNFYGSKAVISQYIEEGRIHHMMGNHEVKGMLTVDSVGTRNYEHPTIGVCTRNANNGISLTNSRLTAFVQMLIREYSEYEDKLEPAGSFYDQCESDNVPWNYHGYPAALITESPTQIRRLHKDTESDIYIDVYRSALLEYAKVVLAFAMELGELYEIPEPQQSATPTKVEGTESNGTESFEGSMAKKMHPTWTVVLLTFIGIWMLHIHFFIKMKINFGIVLFTIALAATFASPKVEIFNVKGTEPEPIYHSRPLYKATLQPLFLHLDPERMTEFVERFSTEFSNRNYNIYRRAERWLYEKIRTVLSQFKVGNAYLREIEAKDQPSNQKNLIAIVEGQDPNKKGNLVILGAHYDTIPNPKERAADHREQMIMLQDALF